MPVAYNMNLIKYPYGSVLSKEGSVPDGLYLIKSGQCKVALSRIAQQKVKPRVSRKLNINENNELFRDFDPEGSLLNGMKIDYLMKQNSRYYVTENIKGQNAEQIRGEIVYEDIMEYN